MALNLRDAFDDVLLLLGYHDADDAPAPVRDRALRDIQAALQQMQSCGVEYYGREDLSFSISAGTSSFTLDADVQTVLEPARFTPTSGNPGPPLRRLTKRSQVDDFGILFLGQSNRLLSNGTPLAYYSEPKRNTTAGAADSVRVTLHLLPPADSGGTLALSVIKEAPEFELSDLCGDSVALPVPHKYVESIFLPLARWNAAGSPNFYKREKLPELQAAYQVALNLLGLNDPRKPVPAESGNADALRSGNVPGSAQREEDFQP